MRFQCRGASAYHRDTHRFSPRRHTVLAASDVEQHQPAIHLFLDVISLAVERGALGQPSTTLVTRSLLKSDGCPSLISQCLDETARLRSRQLEPPSSRTFSRPSAP